MLSTLALTSLALVSQAGRPTRQPLPAIPEPVPVEEALVAEAATETAALRTPAAVPFALPEPSGLFPVATVYAAWHDAYRRDALDGRRQRVVAGQIWYPAAAATASSTGGAAPYIPRPVRSAMISRKYLEQDAALIEAWVDVPTHARLGRPAAAQPEEFEVVVLSHDLGYSHHQYTALAQELASHGYVVVAVNHPYGGLSLLPDGRLLSVSDDPRLATPALAQQTLAQEGKVEETALQWSRDLRLVLRSLQASGKADSPVHGRMALDRVAVIGHSLGASAAFQAACDDPRIVAVVGLDGVPVGSIQEEGLCQPALVLRSATLDDPGAFSWEVFHSFTGGSIRLVSIAGADERSFMDAPFVLPVTPEQIEMRAATLLVGSEPAALPATAILGPRATAEERATAVVAEAEESELPETAEPAEMLQVTALDPWQTFELVSQEVRAFLGQHLRGDPAPPLAAQSEDPAAVAVLELPGY